ncbi:hypothetical protein Psal006b_02910 [Piscirickettsia salmonis]|uniref:Kinase domain protein n=1 Tax=Piscirickettsia salmonis TaxID=1238 RepID=A0A1L6TGK4_PISSA|nr:hypothetical protein [Piscirickettsia salmonis]AKP72876.1 hypothetical protein PSLF89_790 [Piscirickettsia salmonis LF-89 = ATCC VR-1361]ALB21496.1 kinase domain protein [Piscirickettsia salmonis]ALY01716.1 hypothetical protein AWE47_01550 [Piscirickettsia salmonis]AMA41232.1 hypothetical protein AWJ11_01560 [Piscirickettsia salmonis]AOS36421.1 hypothetical protein AVM72_14545 [Piscirickettsia salmonis]
MSFEQARIALQQAGINFQGKEKELEESEKLQEAVIALAQIGALNTNIWQKVLSNPDIREPITTMIKYAVLRVGVTGELQPTPVDPKYRQASSIIANMVIDNFRQYFSTGLIADRTARAWERIQDDERFRDTVLTTYKAGSLSPNVLKIMHTDREAVQAITTLNQAGLLPLPEEIPGPFQDHEALLENANYLRENHILSRAEHQKYQAIFALHEVNKLSQETFKQICDSDHPINTASKILLHEALDQAKTCAQRLAKPTRQRLIDHLKHTVDEETLSPDRLTLNIVRVLSHPLKRLKSRATQNKEASQIAETYQVAEPALRAMQKLHNISEEDFQETLVGTPKKHRGLFGKPKESGNPYSTYSTIKETMGKAKKSPQLVPYSTGDNDDVASPIG